MITILFYTTLKHRQKASRLSNSLITILFYTTLKPGAETGEYLMGLITILFYTTLKPDMVARHKTFSFDHHLVLHYSQTRSGATTFYAEFDHHLVLHYSQTRDSVSGQMV